MEHRDAGLAALGSLDDPVRRRLYDFVAGRREPAGRDEAAAAAGIGRPLAAYHLDKLVELGLLTASYQRPPGRGGPGAGRPAKLYARSAAEFAVTVPPREYELAARLLAAAVESDQDGACHGALGAAARQYGADLGARASGVPGPARDTSARVQSARAEVASDIPAEGHSAQADLASDIPAEGHSAQADLASDIPAEGHSAQADLASDIPAEGHSAQADLAGGHPIRGDPADQHARHGGPAEGRPRGGPGEPAGLDGVVAALRAHGFEPWREDDGVVRLRNCPFGQLAAEHRELVCGMNLALVEGLVAGLGGGAGLRPVLRPEPGQCCVIIATEQLTGPPEPDQAPAAR